MNIHHVQKYGTGYYVYEEPGICGYLKDDPASMAEVNDFISKYPEKNLKELPVPTAEQIIEQLNNQRIAEIKAKLLAIDAPDAYAVALCDWPESEGFPDLSTIPVTPIIN